MAISGNLSPVSSHPHAASDTKSADPAHQEEESSSDAETVSQASRPVTHYLDQQGRAMLNRLYPAQQEGPAIHKLPPELWIEILNHLISKEDKDNLRCVDQRLKGIMTSFIRTAKAKTSESIAEVVKAFPHMKHLFLDGDNFTGDALEQAGELEDLEHVTLRVSNDTNLAAFAQAYPKLQNLKRLELWGGKVKVTDATLEKIPDDSVGHVVLSSCSQVTEDGVSKLRSRLKHPSVVDRDLWLRKFRQLLQDD